MPLSRCELATLYDVWNLGQNWRNIGSGNGSVPRGNKPLPDPMLANVPMLTHYQLDKKEHIAMNCYLKLNKEKCITGPFVTGGSLTKGQQCGKRPHVTNELSIFHDNFFNMITSSHGNAFRVTSLLWGGTLRSRVYSPHKRPAARSLDVFFGVEP